MQNYARADRRVIVGERNRFGIRFNRTAGRGEGGRGVHTLTFTFTNRGNDQPIDARFDAVAEDIRRTIRDFFTRAGDERAEDPYLITMEGNGPGGFTQRTVRTINGITGAFLRNTYENILHSNEVIEIEGFKVIKKIIYN